MPLQTGRDLHVDRVMSNILIGRRPSGYIADQIVPILGVSKQSDLYYKTNRFWGQQYEPGLTARAPGTEARKVSFAVSSDTYYAKNYALGADWPVEDEVNADEVLDWANQHATLVTDRLLMDFEMRVAALADTAANVSTTVQVATAWSNASGSKPIDDLDNQISAFRDITGVSPNLAIIPDTVYRRMRQSDQVRDLLFGDRGGVVTEQNLASLINVGKVLIPSVQVNTYGTGETQLGSVSLAKAWPNKVWLAHVSPLPGRMVDTWVQGFRWTSPMFGTPWAIQRYPFDPKKKIYGLEASYYQDEKVVSPDLAMRIESVI